LTPSCVMTTNRNPDATPAGPTRRAFLKDSAALACLTGLPHPAPAIAGAGPADEPPWYRRTLRWGQTNITEVDPAGYDVARSGEPYRTGELYVACISSPYYDEYIPSILREIIGRSHPEGLTDNSWSGLDRASICYCAHCHRRFRARAGRPIPARKDWD